MKNKIFLAIFSLCFISCTGSNEVKITVENSKAREVSQLVEISIADLGNDIILAEGETFLVKNEEGIFQASQLTYDKKLVFQVSLLAESTQHFVITKGQKQDYEPQVFGRHFPERYDDFAWENDRVGFRFYGKALKEIQAPTNGLDLWYKRTSRLVLEDWYKDNISGKASYHVDHGEGCDPYGVGPTLGAGATAPFVDGKLYRNENYESYEVLDNGPLRITAKLTYPKLHIEDKEVDDIRVVSLDAGSQYTKIEQSYGDAHFAMASGIVKRVKEDSIIVSDNKKYILYSEPMNEKNGQVYLGVIFSEGFDAYQLNSYTIDKNDFNHLLAIKEYVGTPVTYYTGFGWNKFGFEDISAFKVYTEAFLDNVANPIKVTIHKNK